MLATRDHDAVIWDHRCATQCAIDVLPRLNGLHRPLHAVHVAETLKPHCSHVLPTLPNAHWATDLIVNNAGNWRQAREVECLLTLADCGQHVNDIESEPMPTAVSHNWQWTFCCIDFVAHVHLAKWTRSIDSIVNATLVSCETAVRDVDWSSWLATHGTLETGRHNAVRVVIVQTDRLWRTALGCQPRTASGWH